MIKTNSNQLGLLTGILLIFCIVAILVGFYSESKKTQQFDELLQKYSDIGNFSGSVLIAKEGEIVYKKGFGFANIEWSIPNKSSTKFRIGSITKQFTAMLILQQVELGKIDLNTPISKYITNYPTENGEKITIHHLLTHTSGLPNYTSFEAYQQGHNKESITPEMLVKTFQDIDLEFTPGEMYRYSNSGYSLLGYILEETTGKSYEQLLEENIFTPLSMLNSGFDNHSKIIKNRALGYKKKGIEISNANYIDMSFPYAAGAIYSTVEDLFLWDQALYTDQLLSKQYMNEYMKPHVKMSASMEYGYGWMSYEEPIGNSNKSISVIAHPGGINGFNSYISRSTTDKSLIILLNNTSIAPLGKITTALRGIMNEETYDIPSNNLAKEFAKIINENGIETAKEYFLANMNNKSFELIENDMNWYGYKFMNNGDFEIALEIFELNIQAFPSAFNVYDSYGECLLKMGRKNEAIDNYKKSIQLNPKNKRGKKALQELGVDIE